MSQATANQATGAGSSDRKALIAIIGAYPTSQRATVFWAMGPLNGLYRKALYELLQLHIGQAVAIERLV